jgi:MoaA/NifB/PqqE/SkfB family radical SAM enzyme
MTMPPQFPTLTHMEQSEWLADIKQIFAQDQWPTECVRCQEIENLNGTSIRINSIKLHETRSRDDYLQVGGVLDNICNSACQFCTQELSTKIGSLISVDYPIINNLLKFWNLPQNRIEHLDINGGEPSASKNYKTVLANLPKNLKTLRVNTNCSKVITQLKSIQDQGIDVTVTVSFDGIGKVHDYVRWPIEWDKFVKNLLIYKDFELHSINLWTTVNALNINDMENILKFVNQHKFDFSFALLKYPAALNVEFENKFTLKAKAMLANSDNPELKKLSEIVATNRNNQLELDQFIKNQDQLRHINILDFINLD